MEAQWLIKNGQPLSDEHLKALLPMYKILETKLKPKDPIPFIGNSNAGFVVCSTPSGKLLGLGFIHRLLVQATNQIEESQSISAAASLIIALAVSANLCFAAAKLCHAFE